MLCRRRKQPAHEHRADPHHLSVTTSAESHSVPASSNSAGTEATWPKQWDARHSHTHTDSTCHALPKPLREMSSAVGGAGRGEHRQKRGLRSSVLPLFLKSHTMPALSAYKSRAEQLLAYSVTAQKA